MINGLTIALTDAIRTSFADLLRGVIALKPKSWRRELTCWAVLYMLLALIYHLPPLG